MWRRRRVAEWKRVAELTTAARRNVPRAVGRTVAVTTTLVCAAIVRTAQANAITGESVPGRVRQPLPLSLRGTRARFVAVPTRPTWPLRATPWDAVGPLFPITTGYASRC